MRSVTKCLSANSRFVRFSVAIAAVLATASMALAGCGSKKRGGGGGVAVGPLEAAFNSASLESGVPVRMLLAVAWVESRIAPTRSSSMYVNTDDGSEVQALKGIKLSQTAFGLSAATLQLQGNPLAGDLGTQAKAYAALLAARVAELKLPRNPATAEEKSRWIWEIAQLHREGISGRRNVRVVFARELMRALNEGFIWQDNATGETLRLAKEAPELKIGDFPSDRQALLQLDTLRSDVDRAIYFPLAVPAGRRLENTPTHIQVLHCPLTLSACLDMQNATEGEDARLGAHYIIPEDDMISDRALQVARHDDVVMTTTESGQFVNVQDAIVIMLTGNSGRYVSGVRSPAIPTWLSNRQLKLMGWIIDDVCARLAEEGQVVREQCVSMKGPGSVVFRRQQGESYRWGDIADFDETIFAAYLTNPGGLQGETAFDFPGGRRQYAAGEQIPLKLLFQPRARLVEIERLVRCPDQRVVWAPLMTQPVRAVTQLQVDNTRLYDSGPNGNGDQFFRARVYGDSEAMLGWSIDRVYLQNFDKTTPVVPPKYCLRNGT